MSNKAMVTNECNRMNDVARRVLEGRIDSETFFRTIRGDLLITGTAAGNPAIVLDLFRCCVEREDIPTILLTSHQDALRSIQQKVRAHEMVRVMTSYAGDRNYHPFYGMSTQRMLRFLRMTAAEVGDGIMTERVMLYASAVLDVVAARYPVSLPALGELLREDDAVISALALELGLSSVIADNIRGNHEAGIALRRLFGRLEEIFHEIYTPGSDTGYNLQTGAIGNVSGMALYACSDHQRIFNAYLQEELYHTLRRVPRVRVILDEPIFQDQNDVLMEYLLQTRRQGTIELVVVTQNVRESMYRRAGSDFANVVLFQHATPTATDDLSRELFGTYPYHYAVPVAGDTPHILVSFHHTVHWQIQSEERPRVRSQDMYGRVGLLGGMSEYLAIKTTTNSNIYLVPTGVFLKAGTGQVTMLPA